MRPGHKSVSRPGRWPERGYPASSPNCGPIILVTSLPRIHSPGPLRRLEAELDRLEGARLGAAGIQSRPGELVEAFRRVPRGFGTALVDRELCGTQIVVL